MHTIVRGTGSGGAFHPDEPRQLSVGELMRCASFPDAFHVVGAHQAGVNGIGNCVPPLFMRAIAAHLRVSLASTVQPEISVVEVVGS